jgi:hypothetical protein
MPTTDEIVVQIMARSFAMRDALSYLMAVLADRDGEPDLFFRATASALQDRLDALPRGISDLKEKVRAESDWIVGCAQAFHQLRKQ